MCGSNDKPPNATRPRQASIILAMASLATMILLPGRRCQGAGANFVDITAEFRCTSRVQEGTRWYPHEWSHSVHCVVGTNLWFMEGNFAGNADSTVLFTGTNVIEHVVLNKGFAAGKRWTNTWPSDGVVGGHLGQENLAWLAFCSGPCLKRLRVIPLPAPSGYFGDNVSYDRRQVFSDELGLPSNVEFFLPRDSPDGSRTAYWPSANYKVVESTNFQGWTFPLRFEETQSAGPGGGSGTGLYDGAELVIVGHVTSIQQGRKPSIPGGPH
jgi:hypothetical protein